MHFHERFLGNQHAMWSKQHNEKVRGVCTAKSSGTLYASLQDARKKGMTFPHCEDGPMLRTALQKIRQVLISIWHSLTRPPVEKVIEEKVGDAPASQVKRLQRRLARSRQRRKAQSA